MKLVLKSIRKNIIVNKWGKILSLTLLLPVLLLFKLSIMWKTFKRGTKWKTKTKISD